MWPRRRQNCCQHFPTNRNESFYYLFAERSATNTQQQQQQPQPEFNRIQLKFEMRFDMRNRYLTMADFDCALKLINTAWRRNTPVIILSIVRQPIPPPQRIIFIFYRIANMNHNNISDL